MLLHQNGEYYPVHFDHLDPLEVALHMRKDDGWEKAFDWSDYFNRPSVELYKLVISGDDKIQGAIALEPQENFVLVHLVESAPTNRGPDREFYRVGSHLYAFACLRSRQLGFEGCVAFYAKTRLIAYNQRQLHALLLSRGGRMIIDETGAQRLIALYLEDKGGGFDHE